MTFFFFWQHYTMTFSERRMLWGLLDNTLFDDTMTFLKDILYWCFLMFWRHTIYYDVFEKNIFFIFRTTILWLFFPIYTLCKCMAAFMKETCCYVDIKVSCYAKLCYLQVEEVCVRPAVCVSCGHFTVEKLVAQLTHEAGHRNHKTTACGGRVIWLLQVAACW